MEEYLISMPFKEGEERVSSQSYRWDNLQRGDTSFVIIQRTHSGQGSFFWRGRSYDVEPGHAFVALVPEASGYAFEGKPQNPWIFSWLNFYGSPAMALARTAREAHGPVLPLGATSPAGRLYTQLITRRASPQSPILHATECYRFLATWFDELGRRSDAEDDPVAVALRIMENRYHEPLSIKGLASECGMTREHFTRLFSQAVGTGPATHLRAIRWRHASRLLLAGAVTLKETALRCGFPSVTSLQQARAQSRVTGIPKG
ncbi:MAG: AraC family transcriptional regulator [Terrimicrobiaceae bacterium]